jgi:hypothetical protein
MYSAHGWATIWPSYKNDGAVDDLLDNDKMQALRQQIADHIQHLGLARTEQGVANPFAEIRVLNNETHLWLSGSNNHARWHETIIGLFRFIADVAPGSYGLLYTEDDEDLEHANQFRAWVLARGTLAQRGDPFLSPHFPVVEDPAATA